MAPTLYRKLPESRHHVSSLLCTKPLSGLATQSLSRAQTRAAQVMNGPVVKMLALKEESACFLALVTKGNQGRKLSPLFSTQGFPSASSSQDINATFEHHKVTIC